MRAWARAREWAWVYQDEQGRPMTGVGVGRGSRAALLVLVGVILVGGATAECPRECVCKWKVSAPPDPPPILPLLTLS